MAPNDKLSLARILSTILPQRRGSITVHPAETTKAKLATISIYLFLHVYANSLLNVFMPSLAFFDYLLSLESCYIREDLVLTDSFIDFSFS